MAGVDPQKAGVRRQAEQLYQQLDMLQHLRQQARRELLAETRKHPITARLRQIPYLVPIRFGAGGGFNTDPASLRTKRHLWAYSGLALETGTSGEYRLVEGQVRRSNKLLCIRGLNKDHNHDLKGLFKGMATMASVRPGPFQRWTTQSVGQNTIYEHLLRMSRGWMSRKSSRLPVEGEVFFLTSSFMEQAISRFDAAGRGILSVMAIFRQHSLDRARVSIPDGASVS